MDNYKEFPGENPYAIWSDATSVADIMQYMIANANLDANAQKIAQAILDYAPNMKIDLWPNMVQIKESKPRNEEGYPHSCMIFCDISNNLFMMTMMVPPNIVANVGIEPAFANWLVAYMTEKGVGKWINGGVAAEILEVKKQKYEGKTIQELGELFYELSNEHLIPELSDHIETAIEKFAELQADDDELSEMIIIADVEEKLFAFAVGDGSDLENKDSEGVFYIAQSCEFDECMELINHICHHNHPEGYLNIRSVVCDWIGDAMPDIDDDINITIYGGYDYCETEVDPLWES